MFYHRSFKCKLTECIGKSKIGVICIVYVSSNTGFNGQMEGSLHLHWCGNVSYKISGSSCCNGKRDSCSCNVVVAESLKVEDVIHNKFMTYTKIGHCFRL